MFPEARVLAAHELRVGASAEFQRDISEADVLAFAENSGDANPLHVDASYAASTTFGARIVHGAFQVGLASALIGMHLPGRNVLLANVAARFLSPLYFPCRVRVRGEITAWQEETRAGQLKVTVVESSRRLPTAEITIGFTLHDASGAPSHAERVENLQSATRGKPVVLVTGAAGGVGAELVRTLSADYDILAMTRRSPLADELRGRPGVREWQCELDDGPSAGQSLDVALEGRPLFGVVHAAWPGAPVGGLLQAQDDVIEHQLSFGAMATVRLARLLFERVGTEGGRFVAISSIVATQKPVLTLAAYSLGKAALEGAIKLLAPELARRKVTINAVSPGSSQPV